MKNELERTVMEVYELLKAGKKVTTVADHGINHSEDWNHPDAGNWSSENTRRTPILYFWANPQFNRLLAKLADGRQVDIELGFLELRSHRFMEYLEEPKPKSWREVFDSGKLFGCTWQTAISKAKEMNYPYVSWNGRIYSTKDSYQAFPVCLEEEL